MAERVELKHSIAPMNVRAELQCSIIPGSVGNPFEAVFSADGSLKRTYPDRTRATSGFDMIRRLYTGEIGLNPDVSEGQAPVFWLETSKPEEERTSRDATLADAISFSNEDLLRQLIAREVPKMLDRTANRG